MSGTFLILAGFVGFIVVCMVDMVRKSRKDDHGGSHRQRVSQVTGPDGTTRIWHVE